MPEKEAIIPIYNTTGDLIALSHRNIVNRNAKHWVFYKAVEMCEDDIVLMLKGKLNETIGALEVVNGKVK